MSSFFDEASLVMIPSGYKDQKVYSVKPLDGSGDLTFSRASSATRVASNGLIEKVRTNLVTYSEDFANAAWTKNNASVTSNAIANPLNGATTADLITATANVGYVSSTAFAMAAVPYTISLYVKKSNVDWVSIEASDGVANSSKSWFNLTTGALGTTGGTFTILSRSAEALSNGWYRVRLTFSVTSATNYSFVPFFVASDGALSVSGNAGYAFGAQVEISDFGATAYIATTSAAVSVGPVSGLPRLDYLNSTCPRLLLEPQRTNLSIYSEQFDNAGWSKSQSGTGLVPVVTANNAISPDGYQNADTIVFNAGAGTTASDISAIFQTFGGTTATYTASFYAKTASGTAQVQVRIDGSNYDKFTVTNQWQRFTLTKALTGTSNVFEMAIRRGLNEPMNASATIQLWGVQVELGAYATSYIPTLGTSVTRVADAASKTGISSLIGQTEGTIYWEVSNISQSGGNGARLFSYTDGNNFILINPYGTTLRILILSIGTAFDNFISISGDSLKIAVAYKANDYKFYVNGVSVGTPAVTSVPAMSALGITDYLGTGVSSQSATSQMLLFKTRLTNAQLAELTTL
jgi:hypothetical protein